MLHEAHDDHVALRRYLVDEGLLVRSDDGATYRRAVALQRWPSTAGLARGRVLLLHGMSGIADSWWRIGPALAARGWDVTAVDQAGHGGRPVRGDAGRDALAQAILEVYPDGPDVLIGHSLGAITALALLERERGWARTVILEEPASSLAPEALVGLAASITADVAAVRQDREAVVERVRRDCPRWADEDVHWAVQGIAELDPEPFVRHLIALAHDATRGRARLNGSSPPPPRPTSSSPPRTARCSRAVSRSTGGTARRWPPDSRRVT